MKVVYFTHSLRSCWNHGNAHFLRGVLRDLRRRGHKIAAWEPRGAWSLDRLLAEQGPSALRPFETTYTDLSSDTWSTMADLETACADADVVIVHEWTPPDAVAAIGRLRARGGRFTLLFHDTHHRAVSDPQAMRAFELDAYDGILAFGEALAEVYRRWGWGDRVFVWHEAADTTHFHPPAEEVRREGLVWIGNWGDGERSAEIERFLLAPAEQARLPLDIHGVRYPSEALAMLARHGAIWRGWLPNASTPAVFARHLATVHVPRRFYVDNLPGIPTIRVFEALACGIPLVTSPWTDSEGLFRRGDDYLYAQTGDEMVRHLVSIACDPDLRGALAASGLETIRRRHSCAHRVDELLAILARLDARHHQPLEAAS